MRFAFSFRQRQALPAFLLFTALFAFGFWLGGKVLPDTTLSQMYRLGTQALGMTLPGAAGDTADATSLFLSTAGLPGTQAVMALAEQRAALAADAEEILVVEVKPDEQSAAENGEETEAAMAGVASGEVQAIIYCTHASEEYYGERRINGKAGGVMKAAQALVDAFAALGVKALLDETLHDSPDYDSSYARSLETVERLHAEYPDVEVYIDLHRDSSIAGVSTRLTTDMGSFARMMLVVGTDETLEHPNWRQNYAFAQAVSEEADRLEPGIMREPRLYSGRYNQHIASKAILVEVGSTDNDLDEAKRSVEILAQAIVNCM